MNSLKSISVREHLVAFLVLFMLGTLAFSTRWISGKKMLFEVLWDPIPVQLNYPSDKLFAEAFHQGKLALFNPYTGFGNRLLMPSAVTLAHPVKLLSFLWGTDTGFEFVLLFRLILAGYFTYLLSRGLGLSHLSSLLSGIGYMFCGFFRQFYNFLDVNNEMFYPLALLFLIRFFQKLRILDLVLFIWSGYFSFIGGHPSASYNLFGIILVTGFYYLMEQFFRAKGKLISGLSARIFFIGFLILLYHFMVYTWEPFMELLFRGWSFHMPGLGKLHFDPNHLIAFFSPIFDPWLKAPRGVSPNFYPFTPIPSYLGFILGSLALFSLCNLRSAVPTLNFFWFFTLIILSLLLGLPGFHWLLSLPMINRLQNFRYLQPVLALLVSVLAGFGLEQIQKKQKPGIYILLLFGLSLWLLIHFLWFRHYLLRNFLLLWAGFLILASPFLIILLYLAFWRKDSHPLAKALFSLASAELFFYFILISPLYGERAFKIQKPEFLSQVKLEPHLYRFYSPDQKILPPDTATLYQLRDLRSRGPLYPKEYFEFLCVLNDWNKKEEAIAEFFQDGRFYLPLKLERISEPTQDLLFGYLLLKQRLGTQSLLEKIPSAHLIAPDVRYLSKGDFELKGKTRSGILIHPSARLEFPEPVPEGELIVETGLQLSKKLGEPESDGVEFLITGTAEGEKHLLFYRFLTGAEAREKGWQENRLRLKKPMRIEVKTLSGPSGNSFQDFALFGSLEVPVAEDSNYELLDDSGPFLYQRVHRVPRFFLAPKVEWVATKEQALELIRRQELSKEKVILIGTNPEQGFQTRNPISEPETQIQLLKDETDLVECQVKLKNPGWLIMRDVKLAGWRAFLDGEEQRIYRADYLFRAVNVPAGNHLIKFVYQPFSFRIGLAKNEGAFLVLIPITLMAFFRKRLWTRGFAPSRSAPD